MQQAFKAIASVVQGRETRKSKSLTSLSVAAQCAGPGSTIRSREDRVVRIDDLASHISKKYDANVFGDEPPPPPVTFPKVSSDDAQAGFRLFAVFDGHCGQQASTFCQRRLPYELAAAPEFARGDYEQALKTTFVNMHRALLNAKHYEPEAPRNDFASGCTASVVLLTPKQTVMAVVGDSPIIAWKKNEQEPNIVFKEHDLDNEALHDMIVQSNIFLVVAVEATFDASHFLVTGDNSRRRLLKVAQKKVDAALEAEEEARNGNGAGQAEKNASNPSPQLLAPPLAPLSPHHATLPATDDEAEHEIEVFEQTTLPSLHVEDPDGAAVVASASVPAIFSGAPASPTSSREDSPHPDALENRDFDDVRIGLSALNVWGSLGDSSYDPEVFNTFIDEIVEYRRERARRWEECMAKVAKNASKLDTPQEGGNDTETAEELASKRPADEQRSPEAPSPRKRRKQDTPSPAPTPRLSPRPGTKHLSEPSPPGGPPRHVFDFEFDPLALPAVSPLVDLEGGIPYSDFRQWTLTRPTWKNMLRHHISLLPKESAMSRVFLTALRHLNARDKLRSPGVVRVPETKTFENSELRMFVIASDGVIRWYSKFRAEYNEIMVTNEAEPVKIADKLMNKMKW